MKFMLIYRERRTDFDAAAAQRRAARMLNERTMPPGLRVRELVGRIGGGGYAVVETADPDDLQLLAAMFSAYDCRIEPVIDIPFGGSGRPEPVAEPASPPQGGRRTALPDMPAAEPHEGAFSDDDIYDTED